MLNVKNLTVRYKDFMAVDDLSFDVKEGQWLMIVGPNGAGKSTVLNAISQGVKYKGKIMINDIDVKTLKPSERARKIGILAQNHFVGYDFTVDEVVRLGRYAHTNGIFSKNSESDDKAVEEALLLTGLSKLRNKSVLNLSGGELQRTFLAQTFAQNPKILLLDEPSNHLDLVYQKQIFELILEWIKEKGRAVVSVVHDLSLAKAFGSDALLMNKGKKVAIGTTDSVFIPKNLDSVYDMNVFEWMKTMLSQWET